MRYLRAGRHNRTYRRPAFALYRAIEAQIGAAVDVNGGVAIARTKQLAVGVPTGMDTATALAGATKKQFVNSATPHAETASSLTATKTAPITAAVGGSTALTPGKEKTAALVAAVDHIVGVALSATKTNSVGTATDTASGDTPTRVKQLAILSGITHDIALQLSRPGGLGTAVETNTALSLGRFKYKGITATSDVGAGLAVLPSKTRTLGVPVTHSTAGAATPNPKRTPLGTALMHDSGKGIVPTKRGSLVLVAAREVVTAGSVGLDSSPIQVFHAVSTVVDDTDRWSANVVDDE